MANLEDLKQAIDRLGTLLEHKPAGDMQPSAFQTLPPGRALPVSADSIGVSVAKHIGSLPALKQIGQQLSAITDTMKRTGPSSAPRQVLPVAQPLPGTTPLPSTRQIGRSLARPGSIDVASLLSGSFSGTPIVGTAMRQVNLLATLLGDSGPSLGNILDRQKNPSTRAGAYRAFRDEMQVSPAANSIMKAVSNFGPGAIGNRLSKDWNVLSTYGSTKASITQAYGAGTAGESLAFKALDRAVMGAALDFGLVGGSVVAVGAAVVAFGKQISNANRAISGYSPMMAAAFAMSDLRDIFRDMESAQRRAPAEGRFLGAFGDFKDAVRPALHKFLNSIEDAATGILKLVTPLINLYNSLPDAVKNIGTLSPGLAALSTIGEAGQGGPKNMFEMDKFLHGGGANPFKGGDLASFGGAKPGNVAEFQQGMRDWLDAIRRTPKPCRRPTPSD